MKTCLKILFALVLMGAVGCDDSATSEPAPEISGVGPRYGYYYLGDEEIPVVSCSAVSDTQFLLKLSPLEEIYSATTYVVVGVHKDWLGREMDVEYRYHNDDYLFIYEDPVRYITLYRPLQSGKIFLDCNEAGYLKARVDVVLYDGTPFFYQNEYLLPPTTEK